MPEKPVLYIIRGLPGSGKSTVARKLVDADRVFEADQYFMVDGVYRFDARLLKYAHAQCQESVELAMHDRTRDIAVANTFTRYWEFAWYREAAKRHDFSVCVMVCDNDYGNIHGVPAEKIEEMRERFEHFDY